MVEHIQLEDIVVTGVMSIFLFWHFVAAMLGVHYTIM